MAELLSDVERPDTPKARPSNFKIAAEEMVSSFYKDLIFPCSASYVKLNENKTGFQNIRPQPDLRLFQMIVN